ncbi:hypothetical protein GpartN1_g3825.t1 [Galdieria partita]|uniref:Uncharacterized protein n=1 Tax=Galdieria partita TaxID=83374 RepID=A0A9C7PXL7_9RHOD|nr:hypothetical protein GpartN1_g3825.t1 [Galdieria partita]
MALNGNKENVASFFQEPFASIKAGQIHAEFSTRYLQGNTKDDSGISHKNENEYSLIKQGRATKADNSEQTTMRPQQQRRALGDITNRGKQQSKQVYSREALKQGTINANVQMNPGADIVPQNNTEEIEYLPKETVQDLVSPELEMDMDDLKQSVQKWKTKPFCYLTNSKNDSSFLETDEISIESENYETSDGQQFWSIHSDQAPLPIFNLPHIEVKDLHEHKCT